MTLLSREFHFDSAHFIKDYTGKCENLHGHTYRLIVTISGEVGKSRMVLDFSILKSVVEENIIDVLDHKNLNDLFENPTTEIIAQWIFDNLEDKFKEYHCSIYEIVLFEGMNNRVIIK